MLVDHRERESLIPQALAAAGLDVRLTDLPVGDYVLGPGLAAAFGDLTPRPDLMVVAAGNLDGDAHDELVAAVPGCAPATPCEEASRVCCQDGTETTRLFLLDRAGEGFAPIASAPAPITMPAAVSRAFLEENVARVGRLDAWRRTLF